MKRLRGAVAELVGGERRPTGRRGGSGPRRSAVRRRRKVAPRGQRREQLLAHLEKNPGAEPSEIARAIRTTPANVQNVLRKAREDELGRRRSGGGYAFGEPRRVTVPGPGGSEPS